MRTEGVHCTTLHWFTGVLLLSTIKRASSLCSWDSLMFYCVQYHTDTEYSTLLGRLREKATLPVRPSRYELYRSTRKGNPARKRRNSATPRIFPTEIFVEKTKFRNLLDSANVMCVCLISLSYITHNRIQLRYLCTNMYIEQAMLFRALRVFSI